MDAVNTTTALSAAQSQAIELAAPTDESLNAGAMLPDEPIADVLTQEIEASSDVILEMIPKLNAAPAPATESIFNGLHYLRSDMLDQRGMSQRIATEAIALVAGFGKGMPVNYYSRHSSPTGYKSALEEIEAGMQSDVLSQIAAQINRLDVLACHPASDTILETLDFKRRADQITMQASILKEFIQTAVGNGFQWDDACFRGCATDRSQNAVVPSILTIDLKVPFSFSMMDEYYVAHTDAPAMMELMTTHLVQWKKAFEAYLAALTPDASKAPRFDVPKAPTVYFSFGSKTTSIDNIADVFDAAEDKIATPDGSHIDTVGWAATIGNAAQQAKVVDILIRAKAFTKIAAELSATVKELSDAAVNGNISTDALAGLNGALKAFDTTLVGMTKSYNAIVKWCVNAGIATSYAGMLVTKVVEFAWASINQCRITMQMRESAYLDLKAMVDELQAPVVTNVV